MLQKKLNYTGKLSYRSLHTKCKDPDGLLFYLIFKSFIKFVYTQEYTDLVMESTSVINNVTSLLNLVATGLEETTKDTFMEEVEAYTIFKIANFISIYWLPVLVPIGLVCNTLSFLVMIKPNNKKMSTRIYMAAISVNDNIMMCMCSHTYLVSVMQIYKWNSIECRISGFVALFALQNCTFQVLAMTLDKYISIKWPHRAATYSTPKKTKLIVVTLYVCVCIYNFPHFFLTRVIGGSYFNFGISSVMSIVYSWLSFVLSAVIPFTMLIHMKYVIVKVIRECQKLFEDNDVNKRQVINQGMETRQKTMINAENQLTIMLLLVTTFFLI